MSEASAQRSAFLLADKVLVGLSIVLLLATILMGYLFVAGILPSGIIERGGVVIIALLAILFGFRGYNHLHRDSLAAANA